MKRETHSMTAKLTSLWMTWMFLLQSREEIETKGFSISQKNSRSSKRKLQIYIQPYRKLKV
ncbi:hypothetical protein Gotur_027649 [Gossypium turneri]